MSDPNGNLSKGERQGLAAGTRVSWQHEGMAEEATGVVSRVKGETLVLRDGREVLSYYYCRHAPATGGTVEVRVPSAAQARQAKAAPVAVAEAAPGQARLIQRTPEYRAALERVVCGVQRRLAAGEPLQRALAVEAAAAPMHVSLRTYHYWLKRMVKAGKVQRQARGAAKVLPGRDGAGARERAAAAIADELDALTEAAAPGNAGGLVLLPATEQAQAQAQAQGGGVAAESVPEVLRERVAALASEMMAAQQSMECAERLRLLEYGRRSLEQTRALAAALDEAVSTVRRYPWAARFLRQRMLSAAASKAIGGEA